MRITSKFMIAATVGIVAACSQPASTTQGTAADAARIAAGKGFRVANTGDPNCHCALPVQLWNLTMAPFHLYPLVNAATTGDVAVDKAGNVY